MPSQPAQRLAKPENQRAWKKTDELFNPGLDQPLKPPFPEFRVIFGSLASH